MDRATSKRYWIGPAAAGLLLLLVALLGALFWASRFVDVIPPNALTVTSIMALGQRFQLALEQRKQPTLVSELPHVPGKGNEDRDAWGYPLWLRVDERTDTDVKVVFGSIGPDGVDGSADDLMRTFTYTKSPVDGWRMEFDRP